jgi:hypothetical protein
LSTCHESISSLKNLNDDLNAKLVKVNETSSCVEHVVICNRCKYLDVDACNEHASTIAKLNNDVPHMIKRTMLIFMLMSSKFLILINAIIMLFYLLIMIHMLCLLLVPHMFMIRVGLDAMILFLVRLGKFTLVQLLCIKHVMLLLYCYAKMPK